MRNIIWVFRYSGSGKETFLRDFGKLDLSTKLGIPELNSENLYVVNESIKLIAQDFQSALDFRIKLYDQLDSLYLQNKSLLIKGQDLDLENHKVFKPSNNHRLILINLNIDFCTQWDRVKRKPWFTNEITETVLEEWNYWQQQELRKIKWDYIYNINSNNNFVNKIIHQRMTTKVY